MNNQYPEANQYMDLFTENDVPESTIEVFDRHLARDYSFEQLNAVYGVSRALEMPMERLIGPLESEDTDTEFPPETGELPAGASYTVLNGQTLTEYMQDNDLTQEQLTELLSGSISYQLQQNTPVISPFSSDGSNPPPESPVMPKEYVGAPFAYDAEQSEEVWLNSGGLAYTVADFSFPGRNGLDLNISRRYDSLQANDGNFDLMRKFDHTEVVYCYKYYITVSGSVTTTNESSTPWQSNTTYPYIPPISGTLYGDYRQCQRQYDDIIRAVNNQYPSYRKDIISFYPLVTQTFSFIVYPGILMQTPYYSYPVYRYTPVTKGNDHLLQAYGLGRGWSFCLPSVESSFYYDYDGTQVACKYLHLGDGSVYPIKAAMSDGDTNLEGYARKDIALRSTPNGTLNLPHGGSVSYQYILQHKDGRRDYLGARTIVATQDRFGNTISYNFTENGGATVVDSVGNTYILSKTPTAGSNYTLTWSGLPDNKNIVYTINSGKLEQERNQVGQARTYAYTTGTVTHPDLSTCIINYCNLAGITHPTGARTTYQYQAIGSGTSKRYAIASRLDQETGWSGNKRNFSFTCPSDKITSAVVKQINADDSTYTETTHTFNEKHLPTSETVKHGDTVVSSKTFEYEYNLPRKEIMTVPYSQTTEWKYDEKGNLLYAVDTLGTRVDVQYDATHNLATKKWYHKDAFSEVSEEYELSPDRAKVVKLRIYETKNGSRSLKQLTAYSHDGYGNVTEEQKYYGNLVAENAWHTTQFIYQNGAFLKEKKTLRVKNSEGALIASRGGAGVVVEGSSFDKYGRLLDSTDPNGNKTTYSYDGLGRVTRELYPGGASRETLYEASSGVNRMTVTDMDGSAVKRKTQSRYTLLGKLSEVYDAVTNTLLDSYVYDTFCRLTEERKHRPDTNRTIKRKTLYSYDRFSRVVSKRIVDGNSAELYREMVVYDNVNRKETKTVHGDDAAASVVTVTVKDKLGRVEKQIISDAETSFGYDNLGSKTQETNALGKVTRWEYDGAGRIVKETNALNQFIRTEYDALGKKTASYDSAGCRTSYTYDALGRLLTQSTPFETHSNGIHYSVSNFDYDPNGNVVSEKGSRGLPGGVASWKQTDYLYDNRNRLIRTTAHGDGDVVYSACEYDSLGNKTACYQGQVGDPAVTRYVYNSFGKVIRFTDALNQTETFEYDKTGLLLYKIDRRGNKTVYGYDGIDRVLSETVTDSSGSSMGYRGTTYTKSGEKKTESNADFSVEYRYNAYGSLESESESGGVVKSYTYDKTGNRKTFVLKRNNAVQISMGYDYDDLGRMQYVSQNGGRIATYHYDQNGNRDLLTYSNGTEVAYTYNLANLVTTLRHRKGDSVFRAYEYGYSLDGNQVKKKDNSKVTAYTYDRLGRLTVEETSAARTEYRYDRYHNRVKMLVSGGEGYTVDYSYDRNNCLLVETKEQGQTTEEIRYRYDANGNLYSRERGIYSPRKELQPGSVGFHEDIECIRLMKYNGFNQLVFAYLDGKHTQYAYKPNGLRHSKTVDGVVTTHIWDGDSIVTDVKGSTVSKYLRGINLIAAENGSVREYYHHNAHGDVVCLTNAGGSVARQYDFDAFGVEKGSASGDANPFRYCAEYVDLETGSVYLRARYYAPRIGRFTQQDTYAGDPKDPLSLNLYTYGYNNPVRYSDPSGHIALSLILGGALVGAALGYGGSLIGQLAANNWDFSAVNTRSLWVSMGAGAITGALAPFAMGATLFGSALLGAVAGGALLGGIGYGSYHLLNGTQTSFGGYAGSMAFGGASAGLMYGLMNGFSRPPSSPYLNSPQNNGTLNIGAGRNPIDGAYNIDIDPQVPGVHYGNATNLSNIPTGSQSQVIIQNPYKYQALNSEVYRVLQPGGSVNMIGNWSNPFFKPYYRMEYMDFQNLGYNFVSKGPMINPGIYYQTSGDIVKGTILEIILQKLL